MVVCCVQPAVIFNPDEGGENEHAMAQRLNDERKQIENQFNLNEQAISSRCRRLLNRMLTCLRRRLRVGREVSRRSVTAATEDAGIVLAVSRRWVITGNVNKNLMPMDGAFVRCIDVNGHAVLMPATENPRRSVICGDDRRFLQAVSCC